MRVVEALDRRFPRLAAALAPVLDLSRRVEEDELGVQAGSLTYGAFLSIPPALLLAGSVAGFVFAGDPAAQARVLDGIATAIPGLEQVASDFLATTVRGRVSVGALGLLGLIWAASGFAARLRIALGTIFRTTRPGLIAGRLQSIVLGIPVIAALLGAIAVTAIGGRLGFLASGPLGRVLSEALLLAASLVVFALAYRLLTPDGGPTLRGHLPGALAFTAGFSAARGLGAVYVDQVIARSTALYGAIGAIFGLLAFLYVTMWLLLLGAEISRMRLDRGPRRAGY